MGLLTKLKGFLFPDGFQEGGDPEWLKDLVPAEFISNSGAVIPFDYLDLTSYFPRKTSVFGSVTADGVYAQNNGNGGNRFPVMMILSGNNNHKQTQDALLAMTETGDSNLRHPVWDLMLVQILGDIEVKTAFVTEAGQTIIGCEFIETTGLLVEETPAFPSILEFFNDSAGASFAENLNVDDIADKANAIQKIKSTLGTVKGVLDGLTDGVESLQRGIDDKFDSINSGMDILIGQPLALAGEIQELTQLPAKRIGLAKSKLKGYGNIARGLFADKPKPTGYDFSASNGNEINKLFASASVASSAQSGELAQFDLKKDYTDSASDIDEITKGFIDYVDDSDALLDNPNSINDGSGWGQLLDLSSIAQNNLITNSFEALNQLTITTDKEDAAINWCFRLYGTCKPDPFAFFCNSNDLSGDEISIIPVYRELVYYA